MRRALIMLLACLTFAGFAPATGYAATGKGYLFAAAMIPTATQIDNVGYYHIPGTPGETITLQATLSNLSAQALEIKAVPMDAYSAHDGIFYQSPLEVNRQAFTLVNTQYGLAQYMSVTSPIMLAAYQSETVTFTVALPALEVGTLLGSIRFIAFAGTQTLQNEGEQAGNAMMMIDKYQAIDTAVQIDLPLAATPAVTVEMPSIDQNGLTVQISNRAAVIQQNLKGSYEIRDSKAKVLHSGTMAPFKMAPMAAFQYTLPLQHQTLEAGTYSLTVKLMVDGKTETYDSTFTVDTQGTTEAKQGQK